jgi:MarR family transcriptional regulator, transcriptional regulator for hemolysin
MFMAKKFGLAVDNPVEASPQLPFPVLVFLLSRGLRVKLDQRLRPMGVSAMASVVLSNLIAHEDGLIQRELAERLGVEGPTLVRLLDKMERDGWVVRVPSPTDRRQKVIKVTAKAEGAFEAMLNIMQALERQVISVVTPEELAAASSTLVKLIRQLDVL